ARNANKVLFCDTDAFAARIWHERYRGGEPLYWPLPESKIVLYLIPFPDVFLVADVPRDGVHMRYWMHERYIEEFQRRKVPYAVLRGSFEERDAQAISAVDGLLTSGTAT
ncbi:MAG TPA: AAA family ATPase, partial [Candidatus Baltobacteraceae bacterium]|nr:AAA family ATPase [Candidatus Baltobacteraceae bacterium]